VVRESGVVVLEVGVLDTGRIGTVGAETGGTGGPENGRVVRETGVVVLEVGVPDTGRMGAVGAGRVGARAEVVGGEQEWRTWTVAVAGLGGETWISRM
jgi:hypothetical protein